MASSATEETTQKVVYGASEKTCTAPPGGGSRSNPTCGTEEGSQEVARPSEGQPIAEIARTSEGQPIAETSSRRLTRDSASGSAFLDDMLVKMGISESREAATLVRDDLFFAVASPFGLVGKEYQVDWEATTTQLHLRRPGNKLFCCCALLLWGALFSWLAFSIYLVLSPDLRVRSVMEKSWKDGPASLPDIFVVSRDEINMTAESCLIVDGDYGSYKSNANVGRLDPESGGCEKHSITDLSNRQDIDTSEGGCKFKGYNLGKQARCWRLNSNRVVGDFGTPAYRFTRMTMMKEMPVGYSKLSERVGFNVVEQNQIVTTRGKVENAYRVHYYTHLLDRKYNIEMYFRKKTLQRYGYDGLHLHLENIDAVYEAGDPQVNNEDVFQWTTYDWQYQRQAEMEMLESNNQTQTLAVGEVFLRASLLQDIYEERPKLTFMEVPQVVGGFFTGFIAVGVFALKCCRECSRKGRRLNSRSHVFKNSKDDHDESVAI